MEERVKISKTEQIAFFTKLKNVSGLTWKELAKEFQLSDRTFREWAKARYTPHYATIETLSTKFNVPLPSFEILKPHWHIPIHARNAALARLKKYGPPGTIESRRRGGLSSQQARRENPEKYRALGCNVPKPAPMLEPNKELAELCGILLGDGCITHSQIKITLNNIVDKDYVPFVAELVQKIFGEPPSITNRKNVFVITLSGVNNVQALTHVGLRIGNKVRQQVQIPEWVMQKSEYATACVRGLIDTDGCVFTHKHNVGNHAYVHFGLTFTSHSLPLVQGVYNILAQQGLLPYRPKPQHLYIYKKSTVQDYFRIIGSSNPKHIHKYRMHLKPKQ